MHNFVHDIKINENYVKRETYHIVFPILVVEFWQYNLYSYFFKYILDVIVEYECENIRVSVTNNNIYIALI